MSSKHGRTQARKHLHASTESHFRQNHQIETEKPEHNNRLNMISTRKVQQRYKLFEPAQGGRCPLQ
jgi:hypothetical protein